MKSIEEIIARLKPILDQEGLTLEILGQEGRVLNVRAQRVGPGVPVAFLMKAIAGTFKRYHPEITDVCLTEYDPGPEGTKGSASSPEFDRVLRHRAPSAMPAISGVPGVDLTGLDRAQAIRAIENAVRIWNGQQVPKFVVHGLGEDAPERAFTKWLEHYRLARSWHPDPSRPGAAVVHLDQECHDESCHTGEPELVMPGRIVLMDAPPVEEE